MKTSNSGFDRREKYDLSLKRHRGGKERSEKEEERDKDNKTVRG